MPDYNLQGLSNRSFEQLIQALTVKYVSTGSTVFGDGPDDGREATFNGRTRYPSEVAPWEGFGLVQAKFRQVLGSSTRGDADWLIAQINAEFKDWQKSSRKRPKYYLLASNVRLSSTRGGGKERVLACLEGWAKKVGIAEVDVWDYDKIARFLDDSYDIRKAYGAWVLAGDVLLALLDHLQEEKENLLFSLTTYMEKELLDEAHARLSQAGDPSDTPVPLARVFIDLPYASNSPSGEAPEHVQNTSESMAVQQLLSIGSMRLAASEPLSHEEANISRTVIIGGPGQGKTTVGQLMCQLYRASFLSERPQQLLDAKAVETLKLLNQHRERSGFNSFTNRRFPIRIPLSNLAEWLTQQNSEDSTLATYITSRVNLRSNKKITSKALITWLETSPWFLVLDGLDEVPPSSNREQVMRIVGDFLTDMKYADADGLVLATTRPQGYNDEFSPKNYRHRWLLKLAPSLAIQYATRLSEAKYGTGSERSNSILKRIRAAIEAPATARLMTTPLQVTIMTTLVELAGAPPGDRWKLFNDYYEVIYRREQEKETPTSSILTKYKQHIDGIHNALGFELQTRSERSGGTEALLSHKSFEALARKWFQEEEYEEPELSRLVDAVSKAATDRLVFLVAPQSERIGFEIRSPQEFMAAKYLTAGDTAETVGHLRSIVALPFWLNTFLFAAGRCFAERPYLRPSVIGIVCEANQREGCVPLDINLYGSRVAVSLMSDGAVSAQPRFHRILLGTSFGLLELPPDGDLLSIASLYTPQFEREFQSAIGSLDLLDGGCARVFLTSILASRDVAWAEEAFEDWWADASSEKRLSLVKELSRLAREKAIELLERFCMDLTWRDLHRYTFRFSPASLGPKMRLLTETLGGTQLPLKGDIQFGDDGPRGIFNFVPCIYDGPLLETPPNTNSFWSMIFAVARFMSSASPERLADVLSHLDGDLESVLPALYQTNWVLEWVIVALRHGISSAELRDRAQRQVLGDYAAWKAEEEKVTEYGIHIDKFSELFGSPSLVELAGSVYYQTQFSTDSTEEVDKIIEHWRNCDGTARVFFGKAVVWMFIRKQHMGSPRSSGYLTMEDVLSLIGSNDDSSYRDITVVQFLAEVPDVLFWEKLAVLLSGSQTGAMPISKDWAPSLCSYLLNPNSDKTLLMHLSYKKSASGILSCELSRAFAAEERSLRFRALLFDWPKRRLAGGCKELLDELQPLEVSEMTSLLDLLMDEDELFDFEKDILMNLLDAASVSDKHHSECVSLAGAAISKQTSSFESLIRD